MGALLGDSCLGVDLDGPIRSGPLGDAHTCSGPGGARAAESAPGHDAGVQLEQGKLATDDSVRGAVHAPAREQHRLFAGRQGGRRVRS